MYRFIVFIDLYILLLEMYFCVSSRNGEHKLPNSFVYLLIPGMRRSLCPYFAFYSFC